MRRMLESLTIATVGVGAASSLAFAQQPLGFRGYGYGPHMMDWGGGWYGIIFGPLFMIVVLGVVIAAAVFLVRGLTGPWHSAPPPYPLSPGRTPLDILKERYARGEIDKEEFNERRRVLGE